MSLTENLDKGRLPFRCPNRKCGKTGWVPLSQLDRQLMCRACRSRFYLDPIGREMVLGDRPEKVVNHLYLAPPEKHKPDLIERSAKHWSELSPRKKRGVKIGMGIVALVIVALLVRPMFRSRPKFPKELAARAMVVVKALGTNDRDRLAEIAASGTEGDAELWLASVRPKSWPKTVAVLRADANVLYQNPHKGQACVVVDIVEPTAVAAQAAPEALKAMDPAAGPEEGEIMPEKDQAPAEDGKDETPAEDVETAPAPVVDETEVEEPAVAEAPKPAPPPAPPKLKMRLFWTFSEGQWLFDGTETLKNAKVGD